MLRVTRQRRSALATISLAILAALCGLSEVAAGGFQSPYQSITAIGTAFAGASARSDDASFFLYNPASIAGLSGAQTYIDVRGFAPSVEIEPSRAISPLGNSVLQGGNSGNMARSALAAGSVTAIPFGPGLMLGIGSSAPFATDVETRNQWAGRYHLTRSHMVGLNVSSALSWQVTPWLSLAVGAQLQRMENKFENVAVVPQGLASPAQTLAYMKGSGWAGGTIAGLIAMPAPGTRLGVSWRSALTHRITGTAGAQLSGIPVEHVHYDLNLPQTFSIGLEQRLTPSWRMFAEWQTIDWSRFKGFDISFESGRPNEVRPIDWKDTWLAAIGIGYKLLPATEITAGISYDTGASRNGSGTTLSPDANKTLLGLGIIHDMPGIGRISLSYGHLFIQDSPVKADSLGSGSLDGRLKGRMEMFGVGYTVKW